MKTSNQSDYFETIMTVSFKIKLSNRQIKRFKHSSRAIRFWKTHLKNYCTCTHINTEKVQKQAQIHCYLLILRPMNQSKIHTK